MRNTYTLASLLALACCVLGSCNKHCEVPTPSPSIPSCYSGTVVGFDCHNGLLIQVDSQYPIGRPLRVSYTDSLARPNIIAAVNRNTSGATGQRIYFTYVNNATQQQPAWPCTAQLPFNYMPVPHLVLSNVSDTPCTQPR